MDAIVELLTQWGYAGQFVGGILAGSVLPLNSEIVMAALYVTGLDPVWLIVWGTLGNFLGSVINYSIGRMGKMVWVERYLKIKREKLDRAQRWVSRYGAWVGLLSWIPLLGSAITVTLGLMRSNIPLTFIAIFIGKLARYVLVIYGTSLFL
jgi:membrane protein YqaA with SNARE-associated domain